MVRFGRSFVVAAVAALLVSVNPMAVASASLPASRDAAPVQPWLAQELAHTGPAETLVVLVHGTDLASARSAVTRSGLVPLRDLARIDVTIARGTPSQIELASRQPGVTYLEGNQPIEFHLDSSHEATRGTLAGNPLQRDGRALDGSGVSVAVIDSGIDPTHPFFADADGESIVVANLKNMCGVLISQPDNCFVDAGPQADTDTTAAGGHGTHVNGIVAGQPTELPDGSKLRGAAPGARLVSLSMGAGLVIINAHLAQQWVLEHHAAPCGEGVPAAECPPIKVVNSSYGPPSGGEFNPNEASVKLQRALAEEGVVTVWANGNTGGDGSRNVSNPPGQDPTPGVLAVASYFDQNTGTRDGVLSGYSSRGDRERPQTWPDISAPGQAITSACRPYLTICSSGNDPRSGAGPADVAAYNTISGTSMAAPHIAGIAAQLFQADPAATPGEVEHALKATAYRYADGAEYSEVGGYHSSYDKGTGLVDVAAAADELAGADTETGSQPGAGSPSEEEASLAEPAAEPAQSEPAGGPANRTPSKASDRTLSEPERDAATSGGKAVKDAVKDAGEVADPVIDKVSGLEPLTSSGFGGGMVLAICIVLGVLGAGALFVLRPRQG